MKTISEIYNKLMLKETTVRKVVDECLDEIKKKDENIKAILRIYSDEFLNSQIKNAQKMLDEGRSTKLTGIPIIVKDNILIKDEIVSAGSKMLENYTGTYNASVIEKLKEAGAILLASANMDEFAMGSSGENSAFQKTKNPIDINRVPGGSSAGSAAAVSAGYAPLALGSDTGGSIRLPAAFCNLVGYKPTYGSVSRYGLIAMASSLDQIGPFANTVEDAEILFDLISFFDKNDSTSLNQEFRDKNDFVEGNRKNDLKKKIGIPKILNDQNTLKNIDNDILENFYRIKDYFKEIGYEIIDVDIPDINKALAIYYIICPAEVSSNMGRYDGVRYGLSIKGENIIQNFINSRSAGLGDEVRRRILLGTYILSAGYFDAFYNKAVLARDILKSQFEKAFKEVDAIMTPTSAMFPWKFGEKNDPLAMYLADIFTVPANIIGAPAIAIPSKKREDVNENNLPISIHLVANNGEDKKLFFIAKELEKKIQNS